MRPLALLYAYLPPALFSRHGVLVSFAALVWRYLVVISLTGILTLLIIVRAFSLRPVIAAPWRQHSWRAIGEIIRAQPIWHAWGSPENVILLGLPIVLLLAFMASVDGLQRDLLPQYALFFILAARAIEGIFKHGRLIAAATFGIAVIFVVSWTQPWFGFSLESPSNLRYLDFVEAHQAATAFIEQHYADKTILAGWPQYIELSLPMDGYVKRPQRVLAYADTLPHKARMIDLGARFFLDPQDVTLADFDLVYYSEHSYGVPNAKVLPEIIERFHLPLIAEFSKNSERVLIYGNPKRMTELSGISK